MKKGNSETSNLDAQGRRTSSPAASLIYAKALHNISDPDGLQEAKINRVAVRLAKLNKTSDNADTARIRTTREQLVIMCMKFFKVTGPNINERFSQNIPQTDEVFVNTLLEVVDHFDNKKGTFTHMLRSYYNYRRKDEATSAIKEDTEFGGSDTSAPMSLDAPLRRTNDGTTTIRDMLADTEFDYANETGSSWHEENGQETISALDALEEDGAILEDKSADPFYDNTEIREDAILLQTISLISSFLAKTESKDANEMRKLYTRMFFAETLTRVVKLRTIGELSPLERNEKQLFKAVELAFQDSYTVDICRTITQLWNVSLVEGIPQITQAKYSWHLPAKIFIHYLESIEKPASNALVSQQRSKYENLLSALKVTT